jgi:hypothetical protein
MMRLTNLERRWAHDTLRAFTPNEEDCLGLGETPVRYAETMEMALSAAGPKGRFGLRCALWMATWAPLWLSGTGGTMSALEPPERALAIERLLAHPWRPIRDLAMLLKLVTCMALFREPALRYRSGYDHAPEPALVTLGGSK